MRKPKVFRITETRKMLMDFIQTHPGYTAKQVKNEIDYQPIRSIDGILGDIASNGRLERGKENGKGEWHYYPVGHLCSKKGQAEIFPKRDGPTAGEIVDALLAKFKRMEERNRGQGKIIEEQSNRIQKLQETLTQKEDELIRLKGAGVRSESVRELRKIAGS